MNQLKQLTLHTGKLKWKNLIMKAYFLYFLLNCCMFDWYRLTIIPNTNSSVNGIIL